MQGANIALNAAIAELHDMIQHGEEAGLPRLARLQLFGIVGRLEELLIDLQVGSGGALPPAEEVRRSPTD